MKILSRLQELEGRRKTEIRFGSCDAFSGKAYVISGRPVNRKLTKKEEEQKAFMEHLAYILNNPVPNRNIEDFTRGDSA